MYSKLSSLSNNLFLILALLCASISAKSQGMTWQPLPFNIDREVKGMCVDSSDSSLVVYGSFNVVNGDTTGSVFKIKKDSTIVSFTAPYRMWGTHAAIVWKNELYAGGSRGLHRWKNNQWEHLDSNIAIYGFYPYQNKLLIGGNFDAGKDKIGKISRCLVAWDGVQFSDVYQVDTVNKPGFAINSMVEYKGKLYVAGNVMAYAHQDWRFKEIMRFDPQMQRWEPVNDGIQGSGLDYVSDLKVWNDTLIVAGYFKQALGAPGNGIVKYDGQNWHTMGAGVQSPEHVSQIMIKDNRLYVVGNFTYAGTSNAVHLATYQQGKWCGNTAYFDNNIGCVYDYFGKVIVGGGFYHVNGQPFSRMAVLASEGNCHPQGIIPPSLGGGRGEAINLFPNPATSTITLQWRNLSTQNTITLSDVLGKSIFQTTLNGTAGSMDINVSSWPQGLYFYHCNGKNGNLLSGKILKE